MNMQRHVYTCNVKDVKYEKINMDNYFYSIRIEENFRRINTDMQCHIYTHICAM